MDNALVDNAIVDNAIVDNSIVDNSIVDNSIVDNSIVNNNIGNFWIFLISAFVAHGFLDIITFYPNVKRNLNLYLLLIGIFSILNFFLPFITTLFFVIISMYHFGEDFRFIFEKKLNNRKSNKLTASDLRWGGVTLFTSSILSNYTFWDNIVKLLNISNPKLFINLVLSLSIPIFFKFDTNVLYIPTIIGGLIGGIGGIKGLILYSSCTFAFYLSLYHCV